MKWMRYFFLLLVCCLLNASSTQEPLVPPKSHEQSSASDQEHLFDSVDVPVTYQGTFVKMILTLFALILLIVLSVWMLRRIAHGRVKQMNQGRTIKILERRPLSAKSILYLVEISGKKVVIAESQLEVRAITTSDHFTNEKV